MSDIGYISIKRVRQSIHVNRYLEDEDQVSLGVEARESDPTISK